MNSRNELITINTQYLPDLKKSDVKEIFKVSKDKLPELGLLSKTNGSGLYKCVFPNGVSGALAEAKDDTGKLGAIIGKDGIAGQARWVEQSVDPTMMFAAAALHNIEEKLDELIEVTKDMFEFEQIKEESQLYGDVEFLVQTLRDYQFNAGNHLWLNSKTAAVVECQRKSFAFIKEYKELAHNATKDAGLLDDLMHTDDKASDKVDKAIRYLENYQKAVFLFSFSEYVHTLVTESYDENYLLNVQNDIERLSSEYRDVFSEVSYKLENYAKKSLDLKAIDLAGDAAKALGNVAKRTPLINKTNTGEKLISGGKSLKNHSKDSIEEKIKNLSKYQKAPVYQFTENLQQLRDMHHEQLELYSDDDYVYFAEPQSNDRLYSIN
ncbi:MAG: hypothetical protein KBT35_00485 [Firmicutes bacterium]|nr:hypothetical protein [Candidatus Colivicinus equi]